MVISQTPLHITFAGGVTDFPAFYRQHGGAVIAAAIDKYVYVVVKPTLDEGVHLTRATYEDETSPFALRHDLVQEALRVTRIRSGVQIKTLSDLPITGTSLGAESAVTVGLLNALYAYRGVHASARQLAEEAAQIEIEALGRPTGKKDQYIAAHGGLQHMSFGADGVVTIEPLQLEHERRLELAGQLMLLFLGRMRHQEPLLQRQLERIPDRLQVLQRMRDQVAEMRAHLESPAPLAYLATVLAEGWELKKSLAAGISDPGLDHTYDRALAAGALGGKICGAGGGGFLLLWVEAERRRLVRDELRDLRELPFQVVTEGSRIAMQLRT